MPPASPPHVAERTSPKDVLGPVIIWRSVRLVVPPDLRLPTAGRVRAERLAAAAPMGWADSAASMLALSRVGFELVGEVMGCIAAGLTHHHHGSCGYRGGGQARVRIVGARPGWGATRGETTYPYRAERTYGAALDRLRAEIQARGGDGAVSVTYSTQRLEGDLHEIVLTGLAVRARSRTRPARPFLTTYAPVRVAELLDSGWVPVDLHVAVESGLRHNAELEELAGDIRLPGQRRANFELGGYSEVVNRVRGAVRDKLRARAASIGADGAAAHEFDVHAQHAPCVSILGSTDRAVSVIGWANSLANFRPRAAPSTPLVVVPLTASRGVRRG